MSNVIEIEHLYKEYRLGLIGYGTLREDLQSWWAKARGKEDPNSILFSGDQSHDGDTLDHILALNDINLTVERGERLGIIGKNGAGKTTLLKILSRIASPTKGTARIRGRVASLIAVGTGFHGELTGRENIYLNGSILGLRKFEIDDRLDEIVDFSGVEQFIDTPVKRYSTGMSIRLGFAVAAHLDPDVLIVDEVLAVGDAEFRKKAIGKMKSVSRSEERTVLFVSHNMQSIKELCGNTVLLDKGKIQIKGKSEEVVSQYINQSRDKVKKVLFEKASKRDSRADGSVEFTDFELRDGNQEIRSFFYHGEKVFIHLAFAVRKDVKRLYLDMGILSNKTSEHLVYSIFDVSKKPLKSGYVGKIVIEFETNSIQYGIFPFYLQFFGGTYHVYDHLNTSNLPSLHIVNKDSKEQRRDTDSLFQVNARMRLVDDC